MTTRVTVTNEKNSNPSQELVVLAYNPCSGGDVLKVLNPGDSAEYWVASGTLLQIVERQAAPKRP